jgi:hypothetical protein
MTTAAAKSNAVLVSLALSTMLATTAACSREPTMPPPQLTTPYSAVALVNNQTYFGRLEGLGTDYPVLTEVYYVQTQVNQETKEVKNALVKRGSEWHAPDRMLLNADQILFVEPVTAESTVAKLIEQLKKQ